MSQNNAESEKMLDGYIYDYLMKRNLPGVAQAFLTEKNVSIAPVAIDSPAGFLSEWWYTFWDTFAASTNVNYNEIDTQLANAGDVQGLQMQMRQIFYEGLDDEAMRLVDTNYTSMLQRQILQDISGNIQPVQNLNQQLPLSAHDQLLQHDSLMGSPQSSNQLQQQQPFMVQAQQNLISPSANHWESGMLLNNPNVMPHGDMDMVLSNSNCISGDIQPVQNINQQLPLSAHLLQHDSLGSPQSSNQLQQQQPFMVQTQQNLISPSANYWESGVLLNNPNVMSHGDTDMTQQTMNQSGQYYIEQQQLWSSYQLQPDKLVVPGAINRGNEQFERGQIGGKNKQVVSSSRSKFGCDSLDFLGDFTFVEAHVLPPSSTSEVECCDFLYDGKLLATGGRDNKVVLWCTKSYSMKYTLAEHTQPITCVRFSQTMMSMLLATASADRTIKAWHADNPKISLRTFEGHSGTILSVDFHTADENIVWSCDEGEMRSWSIANGYCVGKFKLGGRGATQIRFQPGGHKSEKLVAVAQANEVQILREGGQKYYCTLKGGHKEKVEWMCWVPGGKRIASLSGVMVTVWRLELDGSKPSCIGRLMSRRSKFNTCVPHPLYHVSIVLVIGCQEGLEFWNMNHDKKMTGRAEEGAVSAMAVSKMNGLFATVSRGMYVKLWK